MPLILPKDLPAYKALQDENIFVMSGARAQAQDIRPLEILIVNLMPEKISAEIQLARVLANSPLQVRLTLLRTGSHTSTHTSTEHIAAFYQTLEQVRPHRFDGMIITGAPVEHLEYSQVDYWEEMCALIDFARTNVYSTIFLCWAAMAALHHLHDIPKYLLQKRIHGVFEHRVERADNPLVRGFDEIFYVPHSRSAGIERKHIERSEELRILVDSREAGVHIMSTENGREIYVMGHMEYDKETLWNEYRRDVKRGLNPPLPQNYFIDDDPEKGVLFRWRSHGNLMFSNWLNYYVYQGTPYDLSKL